MTCAIKVPETGLIENFDIACDSCKETPTVSFMDEGTGKVVNVGLCGVCCWGEAELSDPDKW